MKSNDQLRLPIFIRKADFYPMRSKLTIFKQSALKKKGRGRFLFLDILGHTMYTLAPLFFGSYKIKTFSFKWLYLSPPNF
jgi:hypothetical protein